ncbi:SgcJ/EcaC family oxidoreductase [Luteolibacter pohnpeiensis]|uniref:SgcJ/EcaC family oxidoreductase n=1 Tax=Luteolibacter pohnpeiensis TaxID=454153 RepID=A0A934S728_9BACT|nr:SgcJ/EcaC family oxidoreductase [Luteolibacter pohnpeiensis]MBK1880917.1 SgcJ/EcaC family oxidoreductase [Luteolibacter pohnpeiensis]
MKFLTLLTFLVVPLHLSAQEEESDIEELKKTANAFVIAYNHRDAESIANLFTPSGELIDLSGEEIISGREDLKHHYEEIFTSELPPTIAIEVSSVRLVGSGLAIEDGTVHLTPPAEDATPRSIAYTAVLAKGTQGTWQIASSRSLKDITDAAGQLADVAATFMGDWTAMTTDHLQIEFSFEWDLTGKFIIGRMLTSSPDTEALESNIRIGWNAAKRSIVYWIFDSEGGEIEGSWSSTETGWLVRSEGATADGETYSANQEVFAQDENTILWKATQRLIDGQVQPDNELRLVRKPPQPGEN